MGIYKRYLKIVFLIVVTCFIHNSYALVSPAQSPIKRVIYITLDGVRWQDVFLDHSYFPLLWQKYAARAEIYGIPNSNRTMEVASIPVSLASYQSQMAGSVQPTICDQNECGRIKVETFPEALVSKYGFKRKDVAIIASWELIEFAVESVPGTTFINCGMQPMSDPDTLLADDIMQNINQQQVNDYLSKMDRLDKHTYEQALHYYEIYQPRFMWLSFGNADEHAHAGKLAAYHASLKFYDQAIDHFIELLQRLKLASETMIIITTDHGRGNGEHWTDHGSIYPESKQTWAFVLNGKLAGAVKEGNFEHYSTLSIRPTVEEVFRAN